MQVCVVVAALLAFSAHASANEGDLDPTFGTGGVRQVLLSPAEDAGSRAALIGAQPDGRVVLAGSVSHIFVARDIYRDTYNYVLAGLDPAGAVDPSFVNGGILEDNLGIGASGISEPPPLTSTVMDGQGRIYVGGRSTDRKSFLVFRLTPAGGLDPSFANDGVATYPLGLPPGESVSSVRIGLQSDGSIVLAGIINLNALQGRSLKIVRFLADGSPDPTFGTSGSFDDPRKDLSGLGPISVDSQDRVLLAGSYGFLSPAKDGFITRYSAGGQPDQSFGDGASDGFGSLPQIKVDGADRVYALRGQTLRRFTPSGVADSTFGEDGAVELPRVRSAARTFAISGNRILIAVSAGLFGHNQSRVNQVSLGRLLADGSSDQSFGTDGWATTYHAYRSGGISLLPLPSGKVLYSETGRDQFVAQYRADDGGPDDLDADGVPDDRDQCPGRYKTGGTGCPRYGVRLEIRLAKPRGTIRVRTSTNRNCGRGRIITLFRQQPGRDFRIGRNRVGQTGTAADFTPKAKAGDRFYATAKRRLDPTVGICTSGRSAVLKAGVR